MAQQNDPQQVIPAIQGPPGLQLPAPGPVFFGPNLPIPDAVLCAEYDYLEAVNKFKASNASFVTDAEFASAVKKKLAVDIAAVEQTYPQAVAPAWAQQFMAQVQNQFGLIQAAIQPMQNQLALIQNQLTVTNVSVQLPALRARNRKGFLHNDQQPLYPLPSTAPGNVGVLPAAANVFFPPTVGAARALTLGELAALSQFYGYALVAPALVGPRRAQFEEFITLG